MMGAGFPMPKMIAETPGAGVSPATKKDHLTDGLAFFGVLMASQKDLPADNAGEMLVETAPADESEGKAPASSGGSLVPEMVVGKLALEVPDLPGKNQTLVKALPLNTGQQSTPTASGISTTGPIVEIPPSVVGEVVRGGAEDLAATVAPTLTLAALEIERSPLLPISQQNAGNVVNAAPESQDSTAAISQESIVADGLVEAASGVSVKAPISGAMELATATLTSDQIQNTKIQVEEDPTATVTAPASGTMEIATATIISDQIPNTKIPVILAMDPLDLFLTGEGAAPSKAQTPATQQEAGNNVDLTKAQQIALPATNRTEGTLLSVDGVLALKAKRILADQGQTQIKTSTYAKPPVPIQVAEVAGQDPGEKLTQVEMTVGETKTITAEADPVKIEVLAPSEMPDSTVAEGSKPEETSPKNSAAPAASVEASQPDPGPAAPPAAGYGDAALAQAAQPVPTHDISLNNAANQVLNHGATLLNHGAQSNQGAVFQQVVQGLEILEGGSKVTIQLHPDSLGKVDVSLTVKDMTLEVKMVADSPQAAEALQNNMHELTQNLQDKASRYHHLDIQVEVRETGKVKLDQAQPDRREQGRDQNRQETREQNQGHRRGQGGGNHKERETDHRWKRAMMEDMEWH